MYPYKRLLIGLSLRQEDVSTLRYASMIHRLSPTEKVYFVHVPAEMEVPDSVRRAFPGVWEPTDEAATHKMQALVAEHYQVDGDAELAYEVVEGNAVDALLHLLHYKGIDLAIVGEECGTAHSAALQQKLARKSTCSVLVVPENSKPEIGNIMVAVDYSEHSKDALISAVDIAVASGAAKVQCLHVYNVPIGYEKTGKSFEEFAEIMVKNAEEEFKEFTSGFEAQGVDISPIFVEGQYAVESITAEVETRNIDLLVLGARGRSLGAAILLGSVTEELIKTCDTPVLAVKKKGVNLGLLEALLEL